MDQCKKKIQKPFSKKNNERKYEKYCEAKKMQKGHIGGHRKKFNQKMIKLKVWHSYRKKIV